MGNLFKKSHKHRGIPDSSTMIPVSLAAPPVHSHSDTADASVVPSGYPYNSSYTHNNNDPSSHIAYPYPAQPGQDDSSRSVIDQDIKGNKSTEGQLLGNFRVHKTVADSLAKGGGVSQTITDNFNQDKGSQKIGNFETYD